MIVIVDYGMGNLRSVHKALERVGFQASVTQDPAEVKKAAGLIVPGVGAFKKAMENLQELGLVNPIIEFVESGKPFLGICLGLQLLFSGSDEFGFQKGLSLFKGRVVRFPFSHPAASPPKDSLKVPHMGWNTVHIHKRPPVLDGIADGAYFYFVHSYYPVPEEQEIVATTTDYGGEFVSSVSRGNLFACQFHPEKSQSVGLKLLKNFGRLVNR
ncbi:MAG: imidazole glycerol phosphate synthase subunit HisH [Deltaproteobacteria bacterium]|nr:imidazole glycerol phosphate synthase subunit HisH [Deltaproteobacteria bacterium]